MSPLDNAGPGRRIEQTHETQVALHIRRLTPVPAPLGVRVPVHGRPEAGRVFSCRFLVFSNSKLSLLLGLVMTDLG